MTTEGSPEGGLAIGDRVAVLAGGEFLPALIAEVLGAEVYRVCITSPPVRIVVCHRASILAEGEVPAGSVETPDDRLARELAEAEAAGTRVPRPGERVLFLEGSLVRQAGLW